MRATARALSRKRSLRSEQSSKSDQPRDDLGAGALRKRACSCDSLESNVADGIEFAFKFPPSFLALEEMNHVDEEPEPDAVESINHVYPMQAFARAAPSVT